MNISFHMKEQYAEKQCTPEQAISSIRNEDKVFLGGDPVALYDALIDARDRFEGLRLCSVFGFGGEYGKKFTAAAVSGRFRLMPTVLRDEVSVWQEEGIDQMPIHFSDTEALFRESIRPDVLLAHCTPHDEDGYFYMQSYGACGCGRAAIDAGARVIVQVNENIPLIHTDYYRIHISEVQMICEASTKLTEPEEAAQPQPEDIAIAGFIAEQIPNGATLQLGAGVLPNAVGYALGDHRDLGVHSEIISESMFDLMRSGTINNSQKSLLPGLSVAGFFLGNLKNRKFAHKNPAIILKNLAWVNDPAVISQNRHMISVNSCLGVDLRGQICSESIGISNTGGIGGQLDFVRGAVRAEGGKSFIAMRSTRKDKSGKLHSKIMLSLPEGSVVSTPRFDVMYVVTEYGAVNLRFKSVKERAHALIGIAHPEFRETLLFEAKKKGFV